jgi:DNA-binding response OmpR family regulator
MNKQIRDCFAEKTVLIMVGDPILREAIGEILRNLPCNVLTAANRQEAITQFNQTLPFLRKPFSMTELVSKVQPLLDGGLQN